MSILIIPAVDLRAGRCVRLIQGDFTRETTYDDDPVRVAKRWSDLGAEWIHVVDLDGARAGRPAQLPLVAELVRQSAKVELGGGLRTIEDVTLAFDAGVSRVILGTAAIEHPDLLREAIERFGPDRVGLGVDARAGRVAVRGWEVLSEVSAHDVIERATADGVEWVIYTDIERDGTLTSPNYGEVAAVAQSGVRVIASGGIAARDHLERLAEIPGVAAAIVGKALYTGALTIECADDWWIDASERRPVR